ncbi:TetR/AcrR family transcriptional regulator [Sulfitobacter aestuariivivens]|uniref:TetR/AcrR family transcriptional regulator n=1 Tax=Sulfitobacter aestuariivivens TaxID=2766981 RepID=A0A927HEB2_9RHOB|nr:TetR/AcrR family transcriptional regulator [Sulfitobacter aestuariivivens]MBD3664597.1 TetR/AcrR family transcriptional regulator [Sulfitobacter aestuariivivens]
MSSSRLTPDDWLSAGFDTLQSQGPAHLRAEPMARSLGTTKGSFYWHFADVPAFHDALIEAWRTRTLQTLADVVSAEKPVDHRLRLFGRGVLSDRTETAMRVWAHSNATVDGMLQDVDAKRLNYLELLLREVGLANPDFPRALQAALIGLPQLAEPDGMAIRTAYDTLVDTILALAE